MVIISLELTKLNPDRNIFSINVELTSTFLTLPIFKFTIITLETIIIIINRTPHHFFGKQTNGQTDRITNKTDSLQQNIDLTIDI